MKKQILVSLGIVGAVIFVLGFVKFLKISSAIAEAASRTPPPEAVTSITVQQEPWTEVINVVGALAPVQGAILGAEERGRVSHIGFESGALVKKGDILVELDTSVEQSELESAKAHAELAALTLKRANELREKNANSIADLEKAQLEHRSAIASVETLRAQIERKKVVAPFSGRVGIRQVNVGQIVEIGTPIVSLQSFDPIYVDFSVPQQAVRELADGLKLKIKIDAFPDTVFDGAITAINPNLDETTRNVVVQGTLRNVDEQLRPGMYANVSVVLPKTRNLLTVPVSSVNYAPYGDTVYVIEQLKDPQGKEYLGVRQQVVKLGETRGDQVAVVSGLNMGDKIVTSGGFKLRPGIAVVENNSIAPSNESAPTPRDT